ncbi:MAG: PglZ domain-containing protein [Desulfotignum sp.]|nr:PglZ domain-containing protein [Desulfotignum sp.]MCF8089165.1 PglZ domain-containing protein [Desulfotignum sp.]MCF8138394.1 PglZ domain-containing protein [Desulfotignum sp.]
MSITSFIQDEILLSRLQKHQVLVVYDPDARYRDLCRDMTTKKRTVVDAGESSILSRAAAMDAFLQLGRQEIEQLLVYVPAPRPMTEEEEQKDPFALYLACGAVFPDGDGDQYMSICLKAKPDHQTQVRAVFAQDPDPGFAVIDAIGTGLSWPNLRALLNVESTRDILFALLSPSEMQQRTLKESKTWAAEAKALLNDALGLSLKTKGRTWSAIADEFWRYLLFSEFVFDLPESLPSALCDVPHADAPAKPLIEDICERLRSDTRTRNTYVLRAEAIEQELNLADHCKQMHDFGIRDTFAFEERTFLSQAMDALLSDDLDRARGIISRHSRSVWTGKGESQIQWDLLHSALALMAACQDNDRVLGDRSLTMDSLIDFYVTQLREVDRRHREFEQSVGDYAWQDPTGIMTPVQEMVRKQYGTLIEKVQFVFTRHFQEKGWPVSGRLCNADLFDKLIAPKLALSGNKVALILVDALRYELGEALEKQLSEEAKTQITPALVQLPSTTPVGMASLLPGASTGFHLVKQDTGLVPYIHDLPAGSVAQRMEIIRKKYGNRFQEGRLEDFVRNRFKVSADTDLLVLRSVEIDSHFERHPDTAPAEIINALKRIRVAVYKLKTAGYNEAVIATDHGFFMNAHAGPGDTCNRLSGNWLTIHDRSLIGDGQTDARHYCISTQKAGIPCDEKCFAGPLSLAAYRSGMLYYHGGCSLQECVVPVIQLQITHQPAETSPGDAVIKLHYKNGATRITTRVPVIDIRTETTDPLFAGDKAFEILLEAHDRKGNVVGEAKPGGIVNPATGTVTLKPGDLIQVTFKMSLEFEGKFKIKALNPTTMTVYDQLNLETDYTV